MLLIQNAYVMPMDGPDLPGADILVEDGKIKVRGEFQKAAPISASLQKRLLENGMPPRLLEQIAGGRMDIDDGKEETA